MIGDYLQKCFADPAARKKIPGPGEIAAMYDVQLRFLFAEPDLKKLARKKTGLPSPADFLASLNFIKKAESFSNLPNLLKGRVKLLAAFPAEAMESAQRALMATPYLGLDTAQRYYFLPHEFRFYWALMLAIGEKIDIEIFAAELKKAKCIKNMGEFEDIFAKLSV